MKPSNFPGRKVARRAAALRRARGHVEAAELARIDAELASLATEATP